VENLAIARSRSTSSIYIYLSTSVDLRIYICLYNYLSDEQPPVDEGVVDKRLEHRHDRILVAPQDAHRRHAGRAERSLYTGDL